MATNEADSNVPTEQPTEYTTNNTTTTAATTLNTEQDGESSSKRLREQDNVTAEAAVAADDDDADDAEPDTKRTRLGRAAKAKTSEDGAESEEPMDVAAQAGESTDSTSKPRWKAHQLAEEYIDLASNLMLYPTAQLGPYGYSAAHSQYPLETTSALGYLKGSFRRPLVIETWSPYEIAVFEACLGHYGKDFHQVQREIETKTCREVVDFYYVWKKTSHYVRWKAQYVPPHLDVSDDDGDHHHEAVVVAERASK